MVLYVFHILLAQIDIFGQSLKPPQYGDSNERNQHVWLKQYLENFALPISSHEQTQ